MRPCDVDVTNRLDSQNNRRSLRLVGFDYTQVGAYFITVCSYEKKCIFGEIVDGEMRLNDLGLVVQEEWWKTAVIRQEVELDAFQIMPNHLHGIVVITSKSDTTVGAHSPAPLRRAPRSLGAIVAGFKSAATKRVNEGRRTPGHPLWQCNYYEHVIRNEPDLDRIRRYIYYTVTNPIKWAEDSLNPRNFGSFGIGDVGRSKSGNEAQPGLISRR